MVIVEQRAHSFILHWTLQIPWPVLYKDDSHHLPDVSEEAFEAPPAPATEQLKTKVKPHCEPWGPRTTGGNSWERLRFHPARMTQLRLDFNQAGGRRIASPPSTPNLQRAPVCRCLLSLLIVGLNTQVTINPLMLQITALWKFPTFRLGTWGQIFKSLQNCKNCKMLPTNHH